MNARPSYRPWGELEWALSLSDRRRWHFFGCVAPEERSVSALIALHRMGLLGNVEMLRIIDTVPEDAEAESKMVAEHLAICDAEGLDTVRPVDIELEAPLQNQAWKQRFVFSEDTSLCLDISSLPKRFFFQTIKAAIRDSNVRDFLVLYTKPKNYTKRALSSNHGDWATITGFGCEDPDNQSQAAEHLIVGAGFAVGGLHNYLTGRSSHISVDVLIPFPTQPWSLVHRSWESARSIEEALDVDPAKGTSAIKPSFHQVGALDTSTAFEKLLTLTRNAEDPATLAPLGPKPHSAAMCILATQSDRFPVYYAQPKTYALNYSEGYEATYAYWIKHDGINLYSTGSEKR